MQKVADAADISVLFFQLVLIFGSFWVIFGPFWQFWAFLGQFGQFWVIFGLFGVILGNFWAIFGAIFLWQNMPLCYLNHILQLCLTINIITMGDNDQASVRVGDLVLSEQEEFQVKITSNFSRKES